MKNARLKWLVIGVPVGALLFLFVITAIDILVHGSAPSGPLTGEERQRARGLYRDFALSGFIRETDLKSGRVDVDGSLWAGTGEQQRGGICVNAAEYFQAEGSSASPIFYDWHSGNRLARATRRGCSP